jgi:hypothetical protein
MTMQTRKVRTNGGFKIGLSETPLKTTRYSKNIITEYQRPQKNQIPLFRITKPFVDKLQIGWLTTKNYSTKYSGKQLRDFKTVCIDMKK